MEYTFQFIDGSQVIYVADSLEDAMAKRFSEYGAEPWTLVHSRESK